MITLTIDPHSAYKLLYIIQKNEEEWRTVHQSIVRSQALNWPIETTEKEWQKLWAELEMKGAKAFALRRLSKKNYTSFEFEKLLRQYQVSSSTISYLINDFKEKQFLDDEDWLEGFIKKEIRLKLSPRMIFMKLKMKGIPTEIIQDCIKRTYTNEEKMIVLQILLQKEKLADKRKIVAKLARKGFQIEDILFALSKKTIEN